MKDELLQKLKKINPIDVNGVPKNTGNCQWCAIEGARVLLEGRNPRKSHPTRRVTIQLNNSYIAVMAVTTYAAKSQQVFLKKSGN
ncbi:hypothetical protein [Legionella sp. MW5194]|uniref:hypothetical protein n=1 Tax=Legionella sp. MW5194 TaxID=2662448 RepID=UPI00193D224F|nr:hypothetical protein [Legionella sp. MW5194]